VKTDSATLVGLACMFSLAACGSGTPPPAAELMPPTASPMAATPPVPSSPVVGEGRVIVVALSAKSNSHLSGQATFTQVPGGVKVLIRVAGAPPGKIATHVHETGDCSAPDAKSAGGHFNPANQQHGLPAAAEHHLGDLGNIDIAADGTGTKEIVVTGATLADGAPTSYMGRAIIVHEKVDDGGQPVGNAGGRIGCGVIRAGT
jgi:superoxide dismutase, Cu-Zn family